MLFTHGAERKFYDPHIYVFLWITLFTYALRTLYTDRRDGSISFGNHYPHRNFQLFYRN